MTISDNTEGRYQLPPIVTDVADLRVAACLIDCEGWIGICQGVGYNRKRQKYLRYQCTCRVGMTDREWIDWVQSLFGGGIYARRVKNPKHNHQVHWALGSKKLQQFLTSIYPYLKLKKKQALLALEYLEKVGVNDPAWRKAMKDRMHVLNKKGKPVETNTSGSSENELKIESELAGDRKRASGVIRETALAIA